MTRPIQASLDLQALKQNLSIVRQRNQWFYS